MHELTNPGHNITQIQKISSCKDLLIRYVYLYILAIKTYYNNIKYYVYILS